MPPRPPSDFDAMSTASTLVPSQEPDQQQQVRTTLTGRPITHDASNLTNLYTEGSFRAGANTLPPGYTDSSLVHIPIKTAEYLAPASRASREGEGGEQDLGNEVIKPEKAKKGGGVFSKISSKMSGGKKDSSASSDGLKIIAMSRGDYLKYWAKGEDGQFRDDVVDPPGGRAEWLAAALERQEREGLGKVTPQQRTKGTYGPANAFGAAGAMIGGVVN